MTDLMLPTLAAAYSADLVLGDPRWFPHPVRGMGVMIVWGERVLRNLIRWERVAGMLLVVGVVGASYAGSWWLLRTLNERSAWLGFLGAVGLLFSCLSTRDLALESRRVFEALEAEDLPLARQRVGRIVGRDTDRLDRPEVVRATIETIAESMMDGILSPLCYFVLGGVPLAIAYKAINTLDSMVGHRSARYLRFGWAAATLDTLANWLPARLSVAIVAAAAWVRGANASAAWRCAWRDGAHGTVPNAGLPEAAMAGALGVRLGGMNWYQGKPVEIAPMGEPHHPLTSERIPEAIRLMYASSIVAWVMSMAVLLVRTAW